MVFNIIMLCPPVGASLRAHLTFIISRHLKNHVATLNRESISGYSDSRTDL